MSIAGNIELLGGVVLVLDADGNVVGAMGENSGATNDLVIGKLLEDGEYTGVEGAASFAANGTRIGGSALLLHPLQTSQGQRQVMVDSDTGLLYTTAPPVDQWSVEDSTTTVQTGIDTAWVKVTDIDLPIGDIITAGSVVSLLVRAQLVNQANNASGELQFALSLDAGATKNVISTTSMAPGYNQQVTVSGEYTHSGADVPALTSAEVYVRTQNPSSGQFLVTLDGLTSQTYCRLIEVNAAVAGLLASGPTYGGLEMESNATATTVSGSSSDFSQKAKVTGWTGSAPALNATLDAVNGNVTVASAGTYAITGHFSMSGAGNDTLSFAFFANGTTQLGSRATRKVGTGGDVGSASLAVVATLSANDVVSLYIQNESTASNPTIEDGAFSVLKLT